jgi:hypothetical protein
MSHFNYFTEIEEHFVRRRGSHLLVSPLDWSLMAAWRDAGVPLHIAIRGIDIAMDGWQSKKRRPSEKLSTLFYCHDAVMAEHERYLESRVGDSQETGGATPPPAGPESVHGTDSGPGKPTLMHFLGERISEINRLREKQFLSQGAMESVERVESRLLEIRQDVTGGQAPETDSLERDLGVLDEVLVSSLSEIVPPEKREEWEAEAKAELKVYRRRLPKETYRKILDNYLKSRVRRFFEVGELSLFQL